MWKRLVKFLFLPLKKKYLITEIFFWTLIIKFSLKTLGFKRTKLLFCDRVSPNKKVLPDFEKSRNIIGWIERVSAILHASCLTKAMVGLIVLRRYAFDPNFEIGVKKEDGKLEAHAWLTLKDEVILGELSDIEKFRILPVRFSKMNE